VTRTEEQIAYVKGLCEGLNLGAGTQVGQVVTALIETIESMHHELSHTTSRLTELEEYVEAIDEDLNDLELEFYEDERVGTEGDEVGFTVECPNCQSEVTVSRDVFATDDTAEVVCPVCEAELVLNQETGDNVQADMEARIQ
jgi:ribosomal protein S27E